MTEKRCFLYHFHQPHQHSYVHV